MKGDHHKDKIDVSVVVSLNLQGFNMKVKHERPGDHLDGLGTTLEQHNLKRVRLWEELKAEFPNMEYSDIKPNKEGVIQYSSEDYVTPGGLMDELPKGNRMATSSEIYHPTGGESK